MMSYFFSNMFRQFKIKGCIKHLIIIILVMITLMLFINHQPTIIQESDVPSSELLLYSKLKYVISTMEDILLVQSIGLALKELGFKLILVEPSILLHLTTMENNTDIFRKYKLEKSSRIIEFFSNISLESLPAKFSFNHRNTQLLSSCATSRDNCFCKLSSKDKAFEIYLVILKIAINEHYITYKGVKKIPEPFESSLSIKNLTIGQYDAAVDWYGVIEVSFNMMIPKFHTNFLRQLEFSRFIPCNETRKNLFQAEYPNSTISNAVLEKKFVTYITELKRVTRILKMPFWIMSGITLGWYRQCGLIPYTTDIDVAVYAKDYTEDFMPTLLESSIIKPSYSFGTPKHGFILRLTDIIDLCFIYLSQNKSWLGIYDSKKLETYRSEFPRFELCSAILLNLRVNVPCDSLAMIKAEYGEDWYDPNPSYNFMSGAQNLKFTKNLSSDSWKKVLTWY